MAFPEPLRIDPFEDFRSGLAREPGRRIGAIVGDDQDFDPVRQIVSQRPHRIADYRRFVVGRDDDDRRHPKDPRARCLDRL